MNKRCNPNCRGFSRLLWGLLLVAAGILFLGFNFGWLPSSLSGVFFSWQMLLIVIGLCQLFYRRSFFIGMMLLVLGVFFIIPSIKVAFPTFLPELAEPFTKTYWPLLLISFGVLVFLSFFFRPKRRIKKSWNYGRQGADYTYQAPVGGVLKQSAVFGTGEYRVLEKPFQGGELDCVFGGMTLDLRKTDLNDGDTFLVINGVLGGITIYAPSEWCIDVRVDNVFGGSEDSRLKPAGGRDVSKRLIIKGSFVFGGISIES